MSMPCMIRYLLPGSLSCIVQNIIFTWNLFGAGGTVPGICVQHYSLRHRPVPDGKGNPETVPEKLIGSVW